MSGFVQDINQLSPVFYRVVIDLAGSADWANTTVPTNGAVYTQDHSQFTTAPTTDDLALAVARGHLRFLSIVESLSRFEDAQIISVAFDSADVEVADELPTEVKFTVRYDRSANTIESLRGTLDQSDTVIDTLDSAIKYLIVAGVTRNAYSKRVRVLAMLSDGQFEVDQVITVDSPDEAATIYADVTVELIDGTSLI